VSKDLGELFRHNLWANLKVIDAFEAAGEDKLQEGVQGTYGSIRDTLSHLVGAEGRYIARLQNKDATGVWGEKEGYPGLAKLRELTEQNGRTLIDIADRHEPGQRISGMWRGQPYEMSAILILLQAINHATEHRTQISTVFSQNGITPPETDGWAYGAANS